MRLAKLQDKQFQWASVTFPGETIDGVIKHLLEEVGELAEHPTDRQEMADCLLLLCCVAGHAGIDLERAALEKMRINRTRKWEKVNGYFHHVKSKGWSL